MPAARGPPFQLGSRHGAAALGVLRAPADGHEAADIGRHGDEIGVGVREERRPPRRGEAQLVALHEGHAALVHHHAAVGQDARALAVELRGEQHLADPRRVRAVDDDRVEARRRRVEHVVDGVAHHHLGARVRPGVAADAGQVRLGERDHLLVDLHQHRPPHAPVLQHAAEDAAVAAADDQHALGGAVVQQRNMRHHLLVDELVRLGDLHHAVQHQHAPMRDAVEDEDVLVRAADPGDLGLAAETLAPGRVERFLDPGAAAARVGHGSSVRPRLCSASCTRPGEKPAFSAGSARKASQPPQTKMSSAA